MRHCRSQIARSGGRDLCTHDIQGRNRTLFDAGMASRASQGWPMGLCWLLICTKSALPSRSTARSAIGYLWFCSTDILRQVHCLGAQNGNPVRSHETIDCSKVSPRYKHWIRNLVVNLFDAAQLLTDWLVLCRWPSKARSCRGTCAVAGWSCV